MNVNRMRKYNRKGREDRHEQLLARLYTETRCPRCGVGMRSGQNYPACHDEPGNHDRYCRRWANDVCPRCASEMAS